MSVFNKPHTLLSEEGTIGAFSNEAELQCQFVNLSLGELCPVTIIYTDTQHQYKRVNTLRAHDFDVCEHYEKADFAKTNCDNLCINISDYLDRMSTNKEDNELSEILSAHSVLHQINEELVCLEFTCPISKLIKFAFPITFNQRQICVVFVGQYSIGSYSSDGTNKHIRYIRKTHFDSHEELHEYIRKTIAPEIMQFQHNTVHNFRSNINKELKRCLFYSEKELSKAMLDVINYDLASTSEDYNGIVLNLFWSEVKKAYSNFFNEIGADRVTLFIDDDFTDIKKTSRLLRGFNIYLREPNTYDARDLRVIFNTHIAKEICNTKNSDMISGNILSVERLQECFSSKTYVLDQHDFVFYKNDARLSYAILIRYHNMKEDYPDTIVELINKSATNIRFELSSVLTKLSEHATKSILRIYRHEIVHQVLALRTSINSLNPERHTYINPEKIANIFYDCSDCLQALSFMTENIRLFTGSISAPLYGMDQRSSVSTIDIFKDVINKHIAMHRELRDSKNLWFEVTGRSELSHKVRGQRLFLDLMLFNIVSNAVKYAYHSTNIWFDYSISKEMHQTKILEIRNYGSKISREADIYRLYYRGPDIANVDTGSGIGLFISKRLADIMGIRLYHKCNNISKYNVALMEKYINLHKGKSCIEVVPSVSEVQQELTRLQSEKKYSHIVNSNPNSNSEERCDEEINSDILLPTFEVSFILEL